MTEKIAAGFYGKFPSLGDFVNRRITRNFLDPWDEWLQSSVAASKEQLADGWLPCYLSSPIWRFALSLGVCGETPCAGLVMPSVDRVGRYFPLTVMVSLPYDANPIQIALEGDGWFDRCEQLMLALLNDECDGEEFDRALLELGGLDLIACRANSSSSIGFGSQWQIKLDDAQSLSRGVCQLAHVLNIQRLGGYSIWWGHGSDVVVPSLLVSEGLPPPRNFAAMLSGDWQSGDWESWLVGGQQGAGIEQI